MIDRILRNQLAPLARDRRKLRLSRALTRCWVALIIAEVVLFLVNRTTNLGAWWLIPLLPVAALLSVAIIVARFKKLPDDYRELAREIERENPELHVLLLTAVEQQPNPDGQLNYLQYRVVQEALEHHRSSPWGKQLAQKRFQAQVAHCVAIGIFLLLLVLEIPTSSKRSRSGELWAGAVQSGDVSVMPGDTNIERGSGLIVLARFAGKLPVDATLVVKPLNENEQRLSLTRNLADPVFGGGIPEVKGDANYHIEYSTGHTRDFKVTVFDYPKLDHADAKITYPAYTGIPQKNIPNTRRVTAVEGSTIDYDFFLNKAVTTAQLVGKDKSIVQLSADTNNPTIRHVHFTLDQSHHYELMLVDAAGRTNKLPPEFVFEALTNRPPELKIISPRGDQRVSSLQEMPFQAEVSGNFGLRAYGLAYTLADGATKVVQLGQVAGANEKRQFNYLLPLENLGARPEQFLSYYIWADDLGADGKVRRTSSDIYFADIRPFDEIFREGQAADSNGNAGEQNPTEKLSELERQIISATWNLQRREVASKPSAKYKADATVIRDSQQDAIQQLRAMQEKIQDPRLQEYAKAARTAMEQAVKHLSEAVDQNSVTPLTPSLSSEQAASQALLRLDAREYQVARSNRSPGGRNRQRNQDELDELELKQTENRYETQREAAAAQKPEQREQLQVASRLKELAQRQEDLNQRLKELQSALEAAKTEPERAEIRDRLKRLREEQQEMLADVDELRQRMDRPENQSRMSEERRQLDQTRSEVQQASDALNKDAVPQALSSGTRAQRELSQLEQDFRKKNSGQFTDEMRQMRDQARQLAQNQEQISKKLGGLADPQKKTLNDSAERKDLADQLDQQKPALTNLFNEMRRISEQSETAEPLLSKQLYDVLRQTGQDDVDKSLNLSSELVQRGFLPQATQFEQRAHQNIDQLKQGIERAAESVLGDDVEALRLAKRELENLSQQLDQEVAQAPGNQLTNGTGATGRGTNNDETKPSGEQSPNSKSNQSSAQASAGQRGQQRGQPNQSGSNGANGNSTQGQAAQEAQAGGNQDGPGNGGRSTIAGNSFTQNGGPGGPDVNGPLVGENYLDWSDRLRDVEEMVDVPDLRTEVARIRDRARAVRLDYKRNGKKPDWAVVRTQISQPLAEVRSRVSEELARRESKDALVPLDRDPVPAKFSELVRRYYEQLGKSE